MRGPSLRNLWRRYRLREHEQSIPAGESLDLTTQARFGKVLFDPQDPDFVRDPYPLFEYLRENDPVQRGATGAWVLSQYRHIAAALVDPRLGNAPSEYATVNRRNREHYLCARVANDILPFLDPPEHTAPRKLISHSFNQYIRRHPPPLQAIAETLLTELAPRAEFDLMADFATPYAARVFGSILQLDEARMPDLLQCSHWFFYLLTVIPSQQARIRIDHALAQLREHFLQLLEIRRHSPGDDFISFMLRANHSTQTLDQDQLVDNLILLFADGVGNVDKGICNAAALLLRHPDQLQLLRHKPQLLSKAMDECLRFESPAQFIGRVALEPLRINDISIRKNDAVLLLLGSANRDSAQFDNANRFDVTRFPNPHLSFGKSRHACVGAPLVRLQMQTAITSLLDAFPQLELATPQLNWQLRMGHRWLQDLAVVNRSAR